MTPPADLPPECWELIFTSLDHHRYLEQLSLVSTRFLSITDQLRHTLRITSRSAATLPRLLHRFPNVKEVQVSDFEGDLDSLICFVSQSELDLESLIIPNQRCFPIMGFRELGLSSKNLRKLSCSQMCYLRNNDLFAIGNSLPLLEELDISFPRYDSFVSPNNSDVVNDEGILDLSLKLKKLVKIDISGNHFITDESVHSLSTNCVFLREFVCHDCSLISDSGIGLVLRNCVSLNAISVDGIGIQLIDSNFQKSFAYAKNLSELCISDSFISDELLSSVAEAGLALRKLIISECYSFSFVGISCLLCKYQFLVYLDLEGANFLADYDMFEISKFLGRLKFINLSACAMLTSMTLFMLLRNCPLLNEIRMERTNLGVEETNMDFVIRTQVKSLFLAGNNNLSDECIKKVAMCCPCLEVLQINYCPSITEDGIREVLRNCCKIRHLEIYRCMGIKNLDINFELPKLEALKAQGPGIDDEALATIAKRCRALLRLDLEGCLNVTAEGVNEVVQNCRMLKEINLKSCDNVKADIVASTVFSRPSLKKIIAPPGFTANGKQISFFLRHGCFVCEG